MEAPLDTNPYEGLLAEIARVLPDASPVANDAAEKLQLSLAWIGQCENAGGEHPSRVILQGAYGSAVESVSLTAFGLLRPAMLALRSHYELCLQYLFLKDHPRETQSLLEFRWQAPLPSALTKYLREHAPNFETRFGQLKKNRRRTMEEVYGLLSGVAHGNAINSISSATLPSDLVEEFTAIGQVLPIFEGVG